MISLDLLIWFSLDVSIVIGGALAVLWILRLRAPRVELGFCYAALIICLMLPLAMRTQKRVYNTQSFTDLAAQSKAALPPLQAAIPEAIPRIGVVEALLAAAALRLLWLFIGVLRLGWFRRTARPVSLNQDLRQMILDMRVDASILISPNVRGPVTFGIRHPAVLLPESFPALPLTIQRAVLCHELLHVRRNDAQAILAEELVRSVLWFHPAIAWLIARIHLYREQVVDRETVSITGDEDTYLDALVRFAAAGRESAGLELAPSFLKRRHLVERVRSLGDASHRTVTRMATACLVAALPAIAALTLWQFPLLGQPQLSADAPGVTVTTEFPLLHRPPLELPAGMAGGTVTVSLDVNPETGGVREGHLISGPDPLGQIVLRSIRQWHFAVKDSPVLPVTFSATISYDPTAATPQLNARQLDLPGALKITKLDFSMLDDSTAAQLRTRLTVKEGDTLTNAGSGNLVGSLGDLHGVSVILNIASTADGVTIKFVPSNSTGALTPAPPPESSVHIMKLDFSSLDPAIAGKIRSSISLHEGDWTTQQQLSDLMKENWEQRWGNVTIRIEGDPADVVVRFLPSNGSGFGAATFVTRPDRIRVGGNAQAANLIRKVLPVYPPLAKQARVQGTVRFAVIVAKDGTVQNLQLVSGHPLLVPSATDAVRQWVYRPTLLNGEPVEVITQVDVNFTLSDGPLPQQD